MLFQTKFSFRSRKRQNELRRALHKFQCIYWNKYAKKMTIGITPLSGAWEELANLEANICIKFERLVNSWADVNPRRSHLSAPLIHSHLHKINIVHLSDASLFFLHTAPTVRRRILENVKFNISLIRGIWSYANANLRGWGCSTEKTSKVKMSSHPYGLLWINIRQSKLPHPHLVFDALGETPDGEGVCGGAAQSDRLEGLVAVGAAPPVVDAKPVQVTGRRRGPAI